MTHILEHFWSFRKHPNYKTCKKPKMEGALFIFGLAFAILVPMECSENIGTYETFRCPYHYTLFNNKCYKIFTAARTYQEAESVCNTEPGGHLVTINTAEVQAFLETLFTSATKDMFIGFNSLDSPELTWISGASDQNFTNWTPYRPHASSESRCVILKDHESWQWKDVADCTTKKRHFICESFSKSEAMTQMFPTCPYGYEYTLGNHCYGVRAPKETWIKAEEQCQCHPGGHLASVTSQQEQDFIGKLTKWSFLGLTNQDTRNFTTWTDGYPVNYTNWKDDTEPTGGNLCALVRMGSGKWDGKSCYDKKRNSICKTHAFETKQKSCVKVKNIASVLVDGNSTSCLDLAEIEKQEMIEIGISKTCLNKCSSEVHILVTVSNTQSCSEIPIYYEMMSQCNTKLWKKCDVVGDHIVAASQCELVCHSYNTDSQDCALAMFQSFGQSICEIILL